MEHKVVIDAIPAKDAGALMKIQTKINQWITTGILIKYEIHTTSDMVIFNICRKKEA